MKSEKTISIGTTASAIALATLLAFGTAHAAKGGNKGGNSIAGGSSIDITNYCALADDADGKPVLRVTTSIVNMSEETTPYFVEDGMYVVGEQKGKGKPKYAQVGDTVMKTASLGDPIVTDISLCHSDGSGTNLSAGTLELNATVSIDVMNDNKPEYSSQCDDDPATDDIDESNIPVSPADVGAICILP